MTNVYFQQYLRYTNTDILAMSPYHYLQSGGVMYYYVMHHFTTYRYDITNNIAVYLVFLWTHNHSEMYFQANFPINLLI